MEQGIKRIGFWNIVQHQSGSVAVRYPCRRTNFVRHVTVRVQSVKVTYLEDLDDTTIYKGERLKRAKIFFIHCIKSTDEGSPCRTAFDTVFV